MPQPTADAPRRPVLQRIRNWCFRGLVIASVAWGMFSAAVVFAVRYDLLPKDEPAGDVAARGLSLDEARDWPRLRHADWRKLITPDSVMAIAKSDSGLASFLTSSGKTTAQPITTLQLLWDPLLASGAWVVQVARPACNCPYDRVERWDYGCLMLDPRTGRPLARLLRSEIDSQALDYWMHDWAPRGVGMKQ